MNSPTPDDAAIPADALLHLHSLLVDAVRRRRGGDPRQGPVTVAEIYQELVPYRNVRAALGLELSADYEHTLLRLLAGEDELARLEPESAREQLARELESANPNVTLYRRFAACDVWLLPPPASAAPSWLDEHLADEPLSPPAPVARAASGQERVEPGRASAGYTGRTFMVAEDEEADVAADDDDDLEETLSRALGTEQAGEGGAAWRALDATGDADPAAGVAASEDADTDVAVGNDDEEDEDADVALRPGTCMFCDSALPRGRTVRYCPYCGADQEQHPCRACGEAVEPGWAFCIACGEPVAPAGA